jgi:hypothetical protein
VKKINNSVYSRFVEEKTYVFESEQQGHAVSCWRVGLPCFPCPDCNSTPYPVGSKLRLGFCQFLCLRQIGWCWVPAILACKSLLSMRQSSSSPSDESSDDALRPSYQIISQNKRKKKKHADRNDRDIPALQRSHGLTMTSCVQL